MTVWMETFCFICSVRLGVITACVLTAIQCLCPLIYLVIHGTPLSQRVFLDQIQANAELREQIVLNLILRTFDKNPSKLATFITVNLTICIVVSLLAIIGAFRLNKWLLIPFIIVEFIRFIILLSAHIILMVLLKRKLNLGELIASTVAGVFILLFIGYMWATVVAFFQILQLVESNRYKTIYGEDPLRPFNNAGLRSPPNADVSNSGIENVRMTKTPNFAQITPLKNEKNPSNNKSKIPSIASKDKNVITTIQINEPDIELAVREFRNWYGHELPAFRKSNLIRFY